MNHLPRNSDARYRINPRLFGRAIHMPPLAVLLAVSAVALLLGPWWVPLAIPLTAVVSTLLILEAQANYASMNALRRISAEHNIEAVGKDIRDKMSWLKKKK